MSARHVIEHALRVYYADSRDPKGTVERLLAMGDADYAHELAEKIRNTPSPRDPDDYGGLVDMGADWAADLIDPEVLNSGS